jgi:hypothetical protein
MKEFNYKRAWQEVALPAWAAMHPVLRRTVHITCCALPYGQEANLDMMWPVDKIDSGGLTFKGKCDLEEVTGKKCCTDLGVEAIHLKERFTDVDPIVLAKAARTVHDLGHWSPGIPVQPLLEDAPFLKAIDEASAVSRSGGHWKFSNLCDQVLTEKIGMPRVRSPKGNGVSFVVLEGGLRACWSTPDCWTWKEIGWATAENMARVNQATRPVPVRGLYDSGEFRAYAEKLLLQCGGDGFREMTDLSSYMEEGRR